MKQLFLINWSDIERSEYQDYLDYQTLIHSDEEYACLSSMASCDEDSMLSDEVYYA